MTTLETAVTKANLALLTLEKMTEGFSDLSTLLLIDKSALKETFLDIIEAITEAQNEATKKRRNRTSTSEGLTKETQPSANLKVTEETKEPETPKASATPQKTAPVTTPKKKGKPSKAITPEASSNGVEQSDLFD